MWQLMILGDTHANAIERSSSSVVEQEMSSVNHAVGAKHLQGYLNAYAFRWNHRKDEKPMFLQIPFRLVAALRL